jgi:ferredoxin
LSRLALARHPLTGGGRAHRIEFAPVLSTLVGRPDRHGVRHGFFATRTQDWTRLDHQCGNFGRNLKLSEPRRRARLPSETRLGTDFDAAGHLSLAVFDTVGLTPDADVYLCGPRRFMADVRAALAELSVRPDCVRIEIFNGGESSTPGVAGAVTKTPHRPPVDLETGPLVSFARSGIAVHWNPSAYQSLLELAEACDVPVRWSCRTGVCHNCESGLVSGKVAYQPQPLDLPATGNLLICCSRPIGDVVVDL